MSITQRDWNKDVDQLNVGFDKLGAKAPVGLSNTETYVWLYFVAKHLASRAERNKDIAMDAMVMAGIAPNIKLTPQDLGERTLFTGENMALNLKVTERSVGVDMTELRALLVAKGVKGSVFDICVAEAMRPKSKMHTFTATPIIE
jgi:hypothetical protein